MTTGNEELLSDKDTAVALSELTIEGLIDWNGDEDFQLNDKGRDYAWVLWKKLPPKERAALFLLVDIIRQVVEYEKET